MLSLTRRLVASGTMVCLISAGGCQDVASPRSKNLALLTTAEGDPLTVLDLTSGTSVERPSSGVGIFGEDARTLSTNPPVLYYSGGGKLVAFDLTQRAVVWNQQLGSAEQARFGGQSIYADFALALSPDGKDLLAADSYALGSWGVAILDVVTRQAVGFLPNLRVRKMIRIPPGQILSQGGVLCLGTRAATIGDDDGERRRGEFYLLSGTPLSVRDSIKFLSSADSLAGGVVDVGVAANGRYAYFTTYSRKLYKFDLLNHTYVGSLMLPAYGPVAISMDGSSVYVIDASQTRDVASSGVMFVANGALDLAETIDLNAAARDGLPPQLNSIVTSADGLFAYVGAGTPSLGPTYGVQHGSVIVVDTRARQIKRVFPLASWGVRSILPLW